MLDPSLIPPPDTQSILGGGLATDVANGLDELLHPSEQENSKLEEQEEDEEEEED